MSVIWARPCGNVSYVICEQNPRSLISTFVVRCLDSTTPLVVIFEISRLQLASVAEQVGLNQTWSKIPEDMFSRDLAYFCQCLSPCKALQGIHGKNLSWQSQN